MNNKLYSKKGITMIGLIIYIASFLVVTGIVAGITVFFYSNSTLITQSLFSSADYNKLNLYFVKESEQDGNRVTNITNGSSDITKSLEFSNGDAFTFDDVNNTLYYNSICIGEDVQKFKVSKESTSGKDVLNVMVSYSNASYSCKYTMAQ